MMGVTIEHPPRATELRPSLDPVSAVKPKQATVEGISVRRIDIPMRWMEQGEGSPLVLIHGIPTSSLLLREVMHCIVGARGLAWERVAEGGGMAPLARRS